MLAKASKIIPVMLMGKCVQQKTYPAYEYGCAVRHRRVANCSSAVQILMSIGVALFMFSDDEDEGDAKVEKATTIGGIILLTGYMVFDRCLTRARAALHPHPTASRQTTTTSCSRTTR